MRTPLALFGLLLLACGATPSPSSALPPSEAGGACREPMPEGPPPGVPSAYTALLDAPDRSAEDKARDPQRKPAEMLAFAGIHPGMRVADIGAGRGYTSEILARAVRTEDPKRGVVFAQNSPALLKMFAEKPWSERLAKPAMANVIRADREFDDPLPPEATNLDAVFDVLFYHDTVWLGADRAKMNKRIFDALKPGGIYVVIDHSGRTGTGTSEAQTLHRIEESVVLAEIAAAGFTHLRSSDFLRNSADTRDWNDSPTAAGDRRGTSDRFAHIFRK